VPHPVKAILASVASTVFLVIASTVPGSAQTTGPEQGSSNEAGPPASRSGNATTIPARPHGQHSGQHSHHHKKPDPSGTTPADDGKSAPSGSPSNP